jgi:FG-GAP-like repeat
MTKKYFAILTIGALSIALISPAFGNHRTGTLALPELVVSGDFNEDGNADLAVNVTGFDNIAFLMGNGLGGFTLAGRVPTDTLPKGLAIADMNRDKHLDLVGCSNWGYNADVHLGDGAGGFGARDATVQAEGGPNRLILRDFNNDKLLDMIVVGPDEGVALTYLGNGKGGFSLPFLEIEEDIPHCQGITAGDFNGDGNLDVVFTSFTDKQAGHTHLEIFFGDGTGEFPTHNEVSCGDLAVSVRTGDLNKDGKLDLIVGGAGPENTTGNFLQTFLGDGAGNFTAKQKITLESGAIKGEIAIADFNEDSNLDVAFPVAASGIRHVPSVTVHTFFGDGTGNMSQGADVIVGAEPHTAIAFDANKDGHLDLAVSNRTEGTVSIALGNGDGTFAPSSHISVVCEGGVCQ